MEKEDKVFRHLNAHDRVLIEVRVGDPGSSLASVAAELGVSRATVMREIKRNSAKETRHLGPGSHPKCPRLAVWPYCCNACAKAGCGYDRAKYDYVKADRAAHAKRKAASGGPRPSSKEAIKRIDEVVCPLLAKGYSVEAALKATGCDVPASTVRSWIEDGLLAAKRIDLPRAVKFFNKKYDVKHERTYVPARVALNRTIDHYRAFVASGQHFVMQVDTVIGNATNKFAILTMMEVETKLQICMRIRKTAEAVNEAISAVWEALASAGCPFDCILTDNGSEFQGLPGIETAEDGTKRFSTFYCDPYRSGQKGACERNHELLRYCVRKGESIDLLSAEQVLDACSKINSYPRESIGWATPYDAFCKRHPGAAKALLSLGIVRRSPDDIDFKKK